MIELKTTHDTAQAVLWALQEHLTHRLPVREYVDRRYASHDEAFRNHKIGEVQGRVSRLQQFAIRLEKETDAQIDLKLQGESK